MADESGNESNEGPDDDENESLDDDTAGTAHHETPVFNFPDFGIGLRFPGLSVGLNLPDLGAGLNLPVLGIELRLPDTGIGLNLPDLGIGLNLPDLGIRLKLSDFVFNFDSELLVRALKPRRVPANWLDVDVDADDATDMVHAVLDDGIPLGWVPSARVVQLLLNAPDNRARRRVISNNYRGILNDCETVCGRLPAPGALFLGDKIRRSIAALRDGHEEAAQALATNVLDTLVEQHSRRALGVGSGALTNQSYRANPVRRAGGSRCRCARWRP